MKGIARTQKEIEFHDRVAQLGCISCRQEGNYNPWVSIHHAHGRTKPGCHMWVLPLCHPHHQDNGTAIARHPNKRRWEAKYGKEDDLIRAMWTELGVEFTEPVRVAKPVDRDRPKKSTSEAAEVGVVKLREIKPKVDKPVKVKIQTARPAMPKAKIASPAKPMQKAKIQSAGFPKAAKPANAVKAKIPRAAKQPLTEKQAAYIAERKAQQNNNNLKVSQKTKADSKAAAKLRRNKYLEDNKDAIEERKRRSKESRKAWLEDIKSKR